MAEYAVFETAAKIDTTSAPAFDKALSELIAQGNDFVKIDMGNTKYLSSVALRVLLSKHKELKKKKGDLLLSNVSPMVQEIFEITGFSGVLNIED